MLYWKVKDLMPGWERAAGSFLEANSVDWGWHVVYCITRRCGCWTSLQRVWMRKPSAIFWRCCKHCHNKTLILITHRLYGLENMDKICVMEEGHIVEQGDHQTLMTLAGRYARFRA